MYGFQLERYRLLPDQHLKLHELTRKCLLKKESCCCISPSRLPLGLPLEFYYIFNRASTNETLIAQYCPWVVDGKRWFVSQGTLSRSILAISRYEFSHNNHEYVLIMNNAIEKYSWTGFHCFLSSEELSQAKFIFL